MRRLDSKSEPDWVEAARVGDIDAVGWLYEQYSNRIYSYAYVRLGDHADAEDVTGQVFLKMIEKIGEFRWRGAGFAAWLFRIAHNQVVDAQRKQSRQHHLSLDGEGILLPSDGTKDGTDPHHYAERRDFLGHLRGCISQLSDLQAQVITLKYAAGLNNPEIAEVMSRSTNAVNSLHYEALKKLEKLLAEKGYTRGQ